jgi:hypothetical protein
MARMTEIDRSGTLPARDAAFAAADEERLAHDQARFAELTRLLSSVDPADRTRPGYYTENDWTIKDLVAHLGTWMAESEVQLLRIDAGSYVDEPIDIDAMNAQFLAALRDQDWTTCWNQLLSAHAQLLAAWLRLKQRTPAAEFWFAKGADHVDEHLPRLRMWMAELKGAAGGRAGT